MRRLLLGACLALLLLAACGKAATPTPAAVVVTTESGLPAVIVHASPT